MSLVSRARRLSACSSEVQSVRSRVTATCNYKCKRPVNADSNPNAACSHYSDRDAPLGLVASHWLAYGALESRTASLEVAQTPIPLLRPNVAALDLLKPS
jgi:hypothetical protein